jgi:hypothetical protein
MNLFLTPRTTTNTHTPTHTHIYIEIDIDDGLHDRILLQLAFELNKALPRIMKGHPLKYMWAYKYHEDYTGINTHADEAAVNVNIWLTPDDANLDPTSGGLVIFTAKVSYVVDFVPKRQHEHHVVVVVCDVPTGCAWSLHPVFFVFGFSHSYCFIFISTATTRLGI